MILGPIGSMFPADGADSDVRRGRRSSSGPFVFSGDGAVADN
jgi:hypothetical protein